ncbi:MAG: gliding motility-associated C-terminal domain-containing protein [Saprospiraceae bacterium]|nr:gliding motility-associated C-terminal domain-containing protein [Saprospiraceae bacterium]
MRWLWPIALFFAGLGLLVPLAIPGVWQQQMEEVCDNGIDDDQDGLIDLNDPDCECPVVEPVSLVPNPSFEDKTCCPSDRSQLNCAETWIQASEPTTDYIHTCGWLGWDGLPVPMPFPDGEAVVGFRDGRARMGEPDPEWKEYVGACLLSPMRVGVSYRFEFWVGFTNGLNSPAINIHFFGTGDCENLPFGVGNSDFGCPTNGPGWTIMGSQSVSGTNRWVKTSIDVTPTQDIHAIAIGPGCPNRPRDNNLYYFLDNLVLDELSTFEFNIKDNGENPCTDQFGLQVPQFDSLNYQWYLDGVALPGANQSSYLPMQQEGSYQVRVTSNVDCKVTTIYPYVRPSFDTDLEVVICEGEQWSFGDRALEEAGSYQRTIKSVDNCDSTINVNLQVSSNKTDTVVARIFESERYEVGPYSYSTAGQHFSPLQTSYGCDSLVLLDLSFYEVYAPNVFSPNDDGINDRFMILGGEDLQSVVKLQIFDRWGNLLYEGQDLEPNNYFDGWDGWSRGKELGNGVYVYTAILLLEDGKERRISGSVTLMR